MREHQPWCRRRLYPEGWWHSAGCETRDERWPQSVIEAALLARRVGVEDSPEERARCHAFAGAIESWLKGRGHGAA